jgi:hypothetical protein
MGAAIAALQAALGPWLSHPSGLLRLMVLGALIGCGFLGYAAMLHFMGVAQLRELMKALRRSA